jgi:hypothetical protein
MRADGYQYQLSYFLAIILEELARFYQEFKVWIYLAFDVRLLEFGIFPVIILKS